MVTIKKHRVSGAFDLVEPTGKIENFDPEDLDKIFEFMDMIEAYAEL